MDRMQSGIVLLILWDFVLSAGWYLLWHYCKQVSDLDVRIIEMLKATGEDAAKQRFDNLRLIQKLEELKQEVRSAGRIV